MSPSSNHLQALVPGRIWRDMQLALFQPLFNQLSKMIWKVPFDSMPSDILCVRTCPPIRVGSKSDNLQMSRLHDLLSLGKLLCLDAC